MENTTQKLMQQDIHIKKLNSKIRKHVIEKGCKDLEAEENDSFNEIEEFPGVSGDNFYKKDL